MQTTSRGFSSFSSLPLHRAAGCSPVRPLLTLLSLLSLLNPFRSAAHSRHSLFLHPLLLLHPLTLGIPHNQQHLFINCIHFNLFPLVIQTLTSQHKHPSAMAATASHQRHRNVIIIPIDVYRKYTESSSSDSSSMPARWPMSCSRASRDRKADNKFSTASLLTSLHMSRRVKPQIQGGGKPKIRTRAHPLQRHSKGKASSTFQTTTPQRNAESNLAYHTQHHGHQDMVMKAPSNAGSLSKPSAEDLLPFEHPSKPKKSAVTIGGTIATINLHSLPATPSRSMKRGRSASDPPVDPKRIKLRLNVKHSAFSTAAQASPHDHRTTQPVIVISDSDDDMPTAPHVPTPPRQYRLEKHLRRIVDSIFPAHELGNQATLERALATCPQLRYDYLIDRFLGSGSSGFVISAKRITDGKDVCSKNLASVVLSRDLVFFLPLKIRLCNISLFTVGCYQSDSPCWRPNREQGPPRT